MELSNQSPVIQIPDISVGIQPLLPRRRVHIWKMCVYACFKPLSYLVKGTSSRWSRDTAAALLNTEGVKVRKVSVLEVDAHVKSVPAGLCATPFDWLLWHVKHEQGLLPVLPSPWLVAEGYREGCLNAHSNSGRGYGWERTLKVSMGLRGALKGLVAEADAADMPM